MNAVQVNYDLKEKSPMQVTEMVDHHDTIEVGLGISAERGKQLQSMAIEGLGKGYNMVKLAEILSKECKHPNELWFMAYVTGRMVEVASNPMAMMGALIKDMQAKKQNKG